MPGRPEKLSTHLAEAGDPLVERLANAVNTAVMLLTRQDGLSARSADAIANLLEAERKRDARKHIRTMRAAPGNTIRPLPDGLRRIA